MNDHDIQRAVDAIMLLRPEPGARRSDSSKRIEVKRRFDELKYQQELAQLEAGEPLPVSMDFFALGKAPAKVSPLRMHPARSPSSRR
ncbi:hypothetical protein L1D19_23840 [Vibrio natriegens]|uniref:hypothetical protein n=1 Tax=Vibrio natriegens TaxID=691 RepID=UPI001EFCD9C2|nr:hypothetical protein [Vibrio natriegens]MCG9703099.1 hypothetical protein [Vibrio natriegens]